MRITCCVPFCWRTYGNPEGFDEWICREHWKAIRPHRRKVYTRVKKEAKRTGAAHDAEVAGHIWAAMKKEAIERAAGI